MFYYESVTKQSYVSLFQFKYMTWICWQVNLFTKQSAKLIVFYCSGCCYVMLCYVCVGFEDFNFSICSVLISAIQKTYNYAIM